MGYPTICAMNAVAAHLFNFHFKISKMAPPKRRFSQRTLTVIIAVTAMAIALLSRLQPPSDENVTPKPKSSTQSTSQQSN